MAAVANPTPTPVRPNYPGPRQNSSMYLMMQIMMKLTQMMMTQFQGGGGFSSPYGNPGGYAPQNPSPYNFYGGAGSNFLV